jgi:hypothetical protein
LKYLNPPVINANSQVDELLRVWAVGDGAQFFVNAYFESIDVYAEMLLELSVMIASEMALVCGEKEEVLLARLLDSLLSEGDVSTTDFSP